MVAFSASWFWWRLPQKLNRHGLLALRALAGFSGKLVGDLAGIAAVRAGEKHERLLEEDAVSGVVVRGANPGTLLIVD